MASMNEETRKSDFRPPRKTLVWTVFALCAIVVLLFSSNWLNENANVQPGLVNIIKLVLISVTGLIWLVWLMFFSRLKARFLLGLIGIALVTLFFYFFRLIFDGDLGFVRVDSRFAQRDFENLQNPADLPVDLATTGSRDFNQFLGNNRDAVIKGRVLNANWNDHPPKLLWKQPIGAGWSGFAAVNGFAVTQEQRGQDECVTCYDVVKGDLIWIHSAARRHEDTMSFGKAGPRATPTIHEGRVYVQGATGVVECLDGTDGTVVWSVDLTELLDIELTENKSSQGFTYEFEKSPLAWGRSGSPLIYGNLVIVPGGGPQRGPFTTLIAFDKQTGKEIWRGGENMIAYGSPAIAKLLDQTQITLVAESSAMGFEPDSGQVLWETARPGSSSADANCSQVTPLSDNRILLSKAYQLGGELVELSRTNGQISTQTIWKNPRVLKTKMMSPVIKDGFAYSLSDGFLECSDLRDDQLEGHRVWRKRGRFGNGQLLLVGDHLLVHTEYGELKLIVASPDAYRELGTIPTIDGVCWNTICLYDRFLLLRSELEAACFELTLAKEETTRLIPGDADSESQPGATRADGPVDGTGNDE